MKKVSEHVLLLGNGNFNYYLAGNKNAVLIECGTSAGAAIFARQWAELEDKPEVKTILVLHSHFDHVGGIPALKKLFPNAEVAASSSAQRLLSKPAVVKDIFVNDFEVSETYFAQGLLDEKPAPVEIETLVIDRVVGEGDVIKADDGLQLRILDAPGHSICSIAAYLPDDQVMFISDAAGYKGTRSKSSPVFFHNYEHYLDTLKKLSGYPARIVGPGHGGIVEGREEADEYYREAIQAAEIEREVIAAELASGKEDSQLADELYDRHIFGALALYPRKIMLGSMQLLIRRIKEHQES